MHYYPSRYLMHHPSEMLGPLERLVQESVRERRLGLVPALYKSGVRYQREPKGVERWQSAAETYRNGWGDCDKLAVWLAADLRVAGDRTARVVIKLVRPGLMHALVATKHGLRDPSRKLGMGGQG